MKNFGLFVFSILEMFLVLTIYSGVGLFIWNMNVIPLFNAPTLSFLQIFVFMFVCSWISNYTTGIDEMAFVLELNNNPKRILIYIGSIFMRTFLFPLFYLLLSFIIYLFI